MTPMAMETSQSFQLSLTVVVNFPRKKIIITCTEQRYGGDTTMKMHFPIQRRGKHDT